MAITTLDQLVFALEGQKQKFLIAKAVPGTSVSGISSTYFRTAATPLPGINPTAWQSCNHLLLGGIPFQLAPAGKSTYVGRLTLAGSTNTTIELHDRLAQMGGLNMTLTTTQTVGADLYSLVQANTDNLAERIISPDYSKLQWFIEMLAQSGGTATVATVNYTNHLGVATSVAINLPTTLRANTLYPIVPNNGDFIRSVESITLSVSTGSAGNAGVIVTVQRTEITVPGGNQILISDWNTTGLPPIFDYSCLMFIVNAASGTGQTLNGVITLVQG
jgi:hypothetical protein